MEISKLHQIFLGSSGVCTDTRKITPNCLFFALKGDNFNGNLFANSALENGAGYAVVDEAPNAHTEKMIVVDDVLSTLQKLAAYHRQQLKCPVIAITGSNGKTTTKELMAAVLQTTYKTVATIGNLNNHIGVPLTLLSMPLDTEMSIVEMGANHQSEIASYCEYTQPNFGIINNIGKAHLEGFGGEAGVRKGKTELYRHLAQSNGKVFFNADDAILQEETSHLAIEKISYGTKPNYDCFATILPDNSFLAIAYDGEKIATHLVGDYNFPNLMAAICIGKYFGVAKEKIVAAIESYIPSNNRSQQVVYKDATIILDAYNANPSSMQEALANFKKIVHPKKWLILGEMMELGEFSLAEHKKIMEQMLTIPAEKKVVVGAGFSFLKTDENFIFFDNSENAKEWFSAQGLSGKLILIKGSRKNALEKLIA